MVFLQLSAAAHDEIGDVARSGVIEPSEQDTTCPTEEIVVNASEMEARPTESEYKLKDD
jgi:hypothetical protein